MSRRSKTIADGKAAEQEEEPVQVPAAETRRTRSGRAVRPPASMLQCEAPVRTPSRRTRRSVIQERREAEEMETEPAEEKPIICVEPEPVEPQTDSAVVSDRDDGPRSRPAPTETVPATPETVPQPQKKPRLGPSGKQTPVIPLGKPKSGRVWKDRNKQRFSALVRDKPLCSSWEKKMVAKREKEQLKQYSFQLKDQKAKQKEDKRKRREDNLKRREENERKSEVVQVIRNTAKIKRMKKKQLRKIEKRDTLALLQKSNKERLNAKRQKKGESAQELP